MNIQSRIVGNLEFFDSQKPSEIMDMYYAKSDEMIDKGDPVSMVDADYYRNLADAICDAFASKDWDKPQSFMIEGETIYDKREYPEHWDNN